MGALGACWSGRGGGDDYLDCPSLERLQSLFLRMILGVKKSTPTHCMRVAMLRLPLPAYCVLQCGRFWNRLAARDEESLIARCWRENMDLGPGSWSHAMAGMRGRVLGGNVGSPESPWDMKVAASCLHQHCMDRSAREMDPCVQATCMPEMMGNRVKHCPDDVREGFKTFKHACWFQQEEGQRPILWLLPERGNIRVLARFRLGSHHLASEARRDLGLRGWRWCSHCQAHMVEDELHVLLCTAWQDIRARFPMVFQSALYQKLLLADQQDCEVDTCFKAFVNQDNAEYVDALVGYLKLVDKAKTRHNVVP